MTKGMIFWKVTRLSLLAVGALALGHPNNTIPRAVACADCPDMTTCKGGLKTGYTKCFIVDDECFHNTVVCPSG